MMGVSKRKGAIPYADGKSVWERAENMNDILFGNNNNKVIRKISAAFIKADKTKTILLVITISMITFLIFTLLCTGFSYKENFDTMELYLQGTAADGYVESTSSNHSARLDELDFVSNVGEQSFIGLASVPGTSDFRFAMNYYSEMEWETHILPTISRFAGNYPTAFYEIALSQNVLEQLGIENPYAGMKISLDIDQGGQIKTQEFILSGYFTDYVSNSLRPLGTYSGNIMAAGIYCTEQNLNVPDGNIVVSKEFAEAAFSKETLLTFDISSGQGMTYEQAAQVINGQLGLSENQGAMVFHSGSVEGNSFAGIGIALLVVCVVMFCGYLCIYNIVQIAIVKDTQMFGQFKTIGMTPRQIKLFVKRQNVLLCIAGIPLGLLAGVICSRTMIPYFISTLLSGGGYAEIMPNNVSLNPVVFFITILFSVLTVSISCSKPAKAAGKIPPIRAMQFSYDNAGMKKYSRTTHGSAARMAYRNVFREKKKARVVFLSLSAGLTLLICVLTVLSSPDWNKFLDIESPDDFLFTDTSIESIDSTDDAQFSQDFVGQIREIPGVTDVEVTQALEVNFDEAERPKIWEPFIEDKALVDDAEYREIADKAYATAVTLSNERLQTFSPYGGKDFSAEDLQAFASGNSVYLFCTENVNYPVEIVGQTITVSNRYTGQESTFYVAGFLVYPDPDTVTNGNAFPNRWGQIRYNSEHYKYNVTSIYMSEAGMLRLTDTPIIQEIRIQADPQQEPAVKQQLMDFRNGVSWRHLISRSELLPLYQPVLQMMVVIGTAFSIILFLIGLLNFINTIVTSIYSRQKEIAVLEGIGMSRKQTGKMLMFEGAYYCLFTIAIVGTVGILITYGVIQAVRQELYYFTFNPPVSVFLGASIVLLIVCLTVPFLSYRQISKRLLSERLKAD